MGLEAGILPGGRGSNNRKRKKIRQGMETENNGAGSSHRGARTTGQVRVRGRPAEFLDQLGRLVRQVGGDIRLSMGGSFAR